MPEQHASDTTYRDPLDSFTDREESIALFEQFLDAAQPGQFSLLAIKGNSGVGKTFLISYLTRHVCPSRGWRTGQISFSQTSVAEFRSILAALEDGLKNCVPRESLKQYRNKRDEYISRFDDYRASITIHQSIDAREQSTISNVTQNVEVNAQLHERELQLRFELSRALIELTEESQIPFCLFLDGYERFVETDPELAGWLLGEILPNLARIAPCAVRVMICGWQWPGDAAIRSFTHAVELTDFERAQVRSYLENQAVISLPSELLGTEQEELVGEFYELTKGHPLVLGLAVTFYTQLSDSERNAAVLQSKRPLIDEQARIQYLEERLLVRLPEPYRTLLERGPILRYVDQDALQILLNVYTTDAISERKELDDRTYVQFLAYPFISYRSILGNEVLLSQPIFHDLVRRVRLGALSNHPKTKEQLHRAMADYFGKQVEAQREPRAGQEAVDFLQGRGNASARVTYAEWLAEIPAQEFKAILEGLYHRFQVRELQAAAWEEWIELTARAVNRWRRQQAGLLLELIPQLVEEGDPYLEKTSNMYGHYLAWYSRFLEQEARWVEAQTTLKEAANVFEQGGDLAAYASSLNNIGTIYNRQGKLEQALEYYERALALREQVGDPADIALPQQHWHYLR